MQYCSACGESIVRHIPKGDSRERDVCGSCGTIFYMNPRIIAGCIVHRGDEILLCRRAIEPRYGLWTLPAGFMENGETTSEAACRETREEACAEVLPSHLYMMINAPFIHQVHMFYAATLPDGQFAAGEESLEVAFFRTDELPWDELAFQTTRVALQTFIEDRKTGKIDQYHELSILPQRYIPAKKQ